MPLFKVMFSTRESTYRRLNGLDGVGRERGIKQNFLVFLRQILSYFEIRFERYNLHIYSTNIYYDLLGPSLWQVETVERD